ncbi:MAG: hypothetical protein WD159_01755, partial [Patescibacteria group bacterium]
IGGTTTPGRVYRGKRMAGRMGGQQVTLRGSAVLEIDPEGKTAKIFGPLPGPRLSRLWLEYEPKEVSSQQPAASSEETEVKTEETTESEEARGKVEEGQEKKEETNES